MLAIALITFLAMTSKEGNALLVLLLTLALHSFTIALIRLTSGLAFRWFGLLVGRSSLWLAGIPSLLVWAETPHGLAQPPWLVLAVASTLQFLLICLCQALAWLAATRPGKSPAMVE